MRTGIRPDPALAGRCAYPAEQIRVPLQAGPVGPRQPIGDPAQQVGRHPSVAVRCPDGVVPAEALVVQ